MRRIWFAFATVLFFVCECPAQRQVGQTLYGDGLRSGFGAFVDISSNGARMIVSAANNRRNFDYYKGQVFVYELDSGLWKTMRVFEKDFWELSTTYGQDVSISDDGDRIAFAEFTKGLLWSYRYEGGTWIPMTSISGQSIAEQGGDHSGFSIALSANGNRLISGAPRDVQNGDYNGRVQVFEYNQSDRKWVALGQSIYGDYPKGQFGRSVDISSEGNRIIAGAPSSLFPGAVKVFEFKSNQWIQVGQTINGRSKADGTGYSVSITGNGERIVVGSPGGSYVVVYNLRDNRWKQIGQVLYSDSREDNFGLSVSLSDNGSRVIVGNPGYDKPYPNCGQVKVYELRHGRWVPFLSEFYGNIEDYEGKPVKITADGSRIVTTSEQNDDHGRDHGRVRVFDSLRVGGRIIGNIYSDLDRNCRLESMEPGLKKWRAYISPGPTLVETDADGVWDIGTLPQGEYSITTYPSHHWTSNCPATQQFIISDSLEFYDAPSFGFYSRRQCTKPKVSIYAPRLRRCFDDQNIYIQACNETYATGIMDSAYVILELHPYLKLTSSSRTYKSISSDRYSFFLDTIYPGQCIDFNVGVEVSCDAELNQTLCAKALLFPLDSCTQDTFYDLRRPGSDCLMPYDASILSVEGQCRSDSLYFDISNNGLGDMECHAPLRIYVDGQLFLQDSVRLHAGQSKIFSYPATGQTWRIETDQHPKYPGRSKPNATIEVCGDINNWTPGFVNQFPHDDEDAVIDIFCGQVTGSYDPNDKRGFPTGVSDHHYILPNQQLEYVIRFQNTGNDTAFRVVIRDTLNPNLNIISVATGVSSHDYTYRLYGQGILEWTFDNIFLPDSNTNEPESHGFVTYTIEQQKDLSNGTIIENSAGIYFDFNDPIITNQTYHEVNNNFDGLLNSNKVEPIKNDLIIYPNPSDGVMKIDLEKIHGPVEIFLYDIFGHELQSNKYTGRQIQELLIKNYKGVLFVRIDSGLKSSFGKVIIE